jgi:serine/threonine protein kinase
MQDIWALGVIVYEALAGCRAHTTAEAHAAAAGAQPYTWERDPAPAFAQSRLREIVLACLSRNRNDRPTAHDVLAAVDAVGSCNA